VAFLLFAVMVVLMCAAIAYFGFAQRQARARAVAALAQRVGFTYSQGDGYGIAQMPFTLFRQGRGQKAELVLSGTHNNLPLRIFDYEYYIDGGRSRDYHRFTCAVLTIPAACPPLRLSRENVLTRLEDHLTHHDVKLEYDEFNRRFLVNCEDQKFAFALLDGQMMEWLLAADGGDPLARFDRVEIIGPWVLLAHMRIPPASWLNLGTWLDTFHSHIPAIVYSTFPNR
jgi:hypothetical protein